MALNKPFSAMTILFMLLLLVASATAGNEGGFGRKPDAGKPYSKPKEVPYVMGIQGLIYCKSGAKLVPLQGAVARITCLAVDKKTGYELAPFSILSKETDEKGYFFATFSGSEIEDDRKLTQCKAFLNSSPWESCNVPTNVNDGMSGALLVSYRLINNKRMKLHSVGPFIYTTEPKATPSGN